MNQFKPLFLDQSDTSTCAQFARLKRAVNTQPCIRVGGRLDDLNDVGYDRQHHTMFEMLGSWSFGDYYKKEACRLMWDFVTKILGIPTNALYVTYFGGCPKLGLPPDDQTRDVWLDLGVLDQKLMPFGVEHNFWRAGQSSGAGLCGPCTELHVDFRALNGQEGLRCARCLINTPSPQVIELWNCVFITHRLLAIPAGAFSMEALEPLQKRFVDTGMGLERLACVMQGVTSTYDTDVYSPLMDLIQSWTAKANPLYGGEFLPFCRLPSTESSQQGVQLERAHSSSRSLPNFLRKFMYPSRQPKPSCPTKQCIEARDHREHSNLLDTSGERDNALVSQWHRDVAYRLLVDHSRALAHAMSDGLLPGRQGLSLKLRQLIHRATRAAILTGLDSEDHSQSLLAALVSEVARRDGLASSSVYPSVQGPNARQPSCIPVSDMSAVINQEVRSFIPKLHQMEAAFGKCLLEIPESSRLSAQHVRDLMNGLYGYPVSWDMLCAQSHWAGLCVPDGVDAANSSAPSGVVSQSRSFTDPASFGRLFHESGLRFTDDSAKYVCEQTADPPSPSSYGEYRRD